MGVNFLDGQAPPACRQAGTQRALCKFRHLLEENHKAEKIFADVVERLERAGLMMHGGTIVDSTIIDAPSSTKNREGKRDPEMRQTKKGNQYRHGMKERIGVDAGSGYAHTVVATACLSPARAGGADRRRTCTTSRWRMGLSAKATPCSMGIRGIPDLASGRR